MPSGRHRAALITAGTTGAGLAIALKIAQPGLTIFLDYMENDQAANEAASAVARKGAEAILVKEDVGTPEACSRIVARISERTDHLDYIVHSAAVPAPGALIDQEFAEIHHCIDVGAMALLWLVQPAVALLGEGSSVLYLSGIAAETVIPHHGAIGTAKAVGEGIVRYLAIECGALKINFNTLRFGPINSPLFRTAYGSTPSPTLTPSGRSLAWDDVTSTAAFLLSADAAMLCGQTIMVDGGLSIVVR